MNNENVIVRVQEKNGVKTVGNGPYYGSEVRAVMTDGVEKVHCRHVVTDRMKREARVGPHPQKTITTVWKGRKSS